MFAPNARSEEDKVRLVSYDEIAKGQTGQPYRLPDDILAALQLAARQQPGTDVSKHNLENAAIAQKENSLVSGYRYAGSYIKLGQEVKIVGSLEAAVNAGSRRIPGRLF